MAYEYDHDCPFEAFITNLGKYNEGELVGEWVKFPTTSEELQKVFERIGIGSKDDFGNPYEEWFISDYDCYVDGLYEKLGEYENLDELNYLASKLDELDDHDYNHFQAAMQISDYTGSIKDVINLIDKPALIYVKNFIDQQNLQVKTSKNYSSPPVKVTGQDLYNLQPNYTYNNNTDFNNTNPILSADEDRMRYEKYFMEQLNIEALKQDYPYDREMIDGIMDLILDVVCSKRKIICIAGDVKSVNVVKGRFMKLNMEHIRYVMNCMQENTTKIRSIKQYMLAALYNAPATIDSYYRAEVNHDMAEGKI